MRDLAFALLYDTFKTARTPALWVVDENIDIADIPDGLHGFSAITNRFDVAQALETKGWDYQLNDYLLEAQPREHFASIFLRIPKEKAQGHYLINQSGQLLCHGGSLFLSGMKQEGIKGFIDRAAKLSGQSADLWKADKQTWAGEIRFEGPMGEPLEDKDYRILRPAPQDDHFHFLSKPGIFGWDKIDQGSALLVSHLPSLIQPYSDINCALDLGCGYGYLTLHTGRLLNIPVVATDNNAAAVFACQHNLAQAQRQGDVTLDDCGTHVEGEFPLVICNPPFHSGFSVDNDLTDRFLASAADHLTKTGVAIFVTNLHIPLERKASHFFQRTETMINNGHFKLVRLSLPKK
ncbi:methyltransferase [Neptunomonas concharum]|uniref:Methyltransferase n=1 Tax=Neptunomonas concharum TaxID=1031538 RepID=A0A5P1REB7_9GAMM|nr:methyltransferase [Neptunomonas concharum]QEQ97953.1 methyltransferase [Neptunomonas concharum]